MMAAPFRTAPRCVVLLQSVRCPRDRTLRCPKRDEPIRDIALRSEQQMTGWIPGTSSVIGARVGDRGGLIDFRGDGAGY